MGVQEYELAPKLDFLLDGFPLLIERTVSGSVHSTGNSGQMFAPHFLWFPTQEPPLPPCESPLLRQSICKSLT